MARSLVDDGQREARKENERRGESKSEGSRRESKASDGSLRRPRALPSATEQTSKRSVTAKIEPKALSSVAASLSISGTGRHGHVAVANAKLMGDARGNACKVLFSLTRGRRI